MRSVARCTASLWRFSPRARCRRFCTSLYYHLREDFAIPHIALRLWRGGGEGAEFGAVSAELRDYSAHLAEPDCGPSENAEAATWFGEAGPLIRSVALVPLDRARHHVRHARARRGGTSALLPRDGDALFEARRRHGQRGAAAIHLR